MPRAARLDAPGVVHHIIIRGIERRKIFRDNKDREQFLERLAKLLSTTGTACYAWALLPNHAHFLFRPARLPLATVMRRLLTGYAVSFNRRHKRHGHLFQNRYKSIVCQEDQYFQELVRYIHLNPLRASLVPDLATLNRYPYCGHSAVVGRWQHPWQDVTYVLRTFGRTTGKGRKAYLAFVAQGEGQGRREELVGGGLIRSLGGWEEVRRRRMQSRAHLKSDERILGDTDFVEEILAQARERFTHRFELQRRGIDLDRVATRAAELYGITAEEVFGKGRQLRRVEARSLFCFWAARELGMPLTDLARRLGMSPPGVGYAVLRGERIATAKGFGL